MVKIRTGIVNYLNTKPLLYGIEHSTVLDEIELIPGYPSEIARLLAEGRIDLGLVPVAALSKIQDAEIISDYCIGCDGPVASVCIFSDVPMEEVEEVLMDYQSMTSVQLSKILLKEYWNSTASYKDAQPDFRSAIRGSTAGLVIGDRAFEQRKISKFTYDLGEAWKNYTGLPFVFAAWVSNKTLPKPFVDRFNAANLRGIQQIDEVVKNTSFPLFDLEKYYRNNVSYMLDNRKKHGMEIFLSKVAEFRKAV